MDRLHNVLNELERISKIIFNTGSASDLEELMEKLEMLQEDAMLYHDERQKEEDE